MGKKNNITWIDLGMPVFYDMRIGIYGIPGLSLCLAICCIICLIADFHKLEFSTSRIVETHATSGV